ncbi:MAG: hypothetical protein KC496_12115 [Anaerolineae bacterium]|nr:hypothetical protein [Anaerolineae bacterium]
MQRRIFVVIALVTLVTFIGSSLAQSETSSPTPAPSKTSLPPPSSTPVTESDEAQATDDVAATIPALSPLPRSYTQEDLAVLVGNVQLPNGLLWYENDLYAVCSGDWTLYRVQSETGATITFVFGIRDAHMIALEETDAGFDLWVPDFDTDQIFIVDQAQNAPTMLAEDLLDGPWGIALLEDNSALVTNARGNTLVHVTSEGQTRIIAEGFRSPTGIVIDGETVYVANNGSARRAIEWFSTEELPLADEEADPATDIPQPLVSGLQNVSNLFLAADGYLYFTYALGTRGVVGRVDPVACQDGGCSNDQVEIVLFTELQAPLAGLTISDDMRLFVHTIYRPEIYWVQLYE